MKIGKLYSYSITRGYRAVDYLEKMQKLRSKKKTPKDDNPFKVIFWIKEHEPFMLIQAQRSTDTDNLSISFEEEWYDCVVLSKEGQVGRAFLEAADMTELSEESLKDDGITATSPEFKEILKNANPWNGPLPKGWR